MQDRPGQVGQYWLSKRRGSNRWCRTWYDPATEQTRRASLGTSDFQEAHLKLLHWWARHGQQYRQSAAETPLETVLVRYWEAHGRTLASAEMTRIALRYWSDFFPAATVEQIVPSRQREFIAWLKTSGHSDGYIKRVLTVGKAALNRAVKEGELHQAPYILPGRDAPPKDLVLTTEQSRALWAAADTDHERAFLALAYATLARPTAILDLRREYVDFGRRLLAQNPPGRRQTRKYRPVVPICDWLLPTLQSAPPGHLVNWHGKPIASMKTAWRSMRRRAGLPVEAVPKTIRHTMATELRAANVPEAEIQGFLGHKAYSGRTEIYAKYRPDYLGAAARAIDESLIRLRVSTVLVGQSNSGQKTGK